MNNRTDMPMRTDSAFTVREDLLRSFIRKTNADARLPMMIRKARPISNFMIDYLQNKPVLAALTEVCHD